MIGFYTGLDRKALLRQLNSRPAFATIDSSSSSSSGRDDEGCRGMPGGWRGGMKIFFCGPQSIWRKGGLVDWDMLWGDTKPALSLNTADGLDQSKWSASWGSSTFHGRDSTEGRLHILLFSKPDSTWFTDKRFLSGNQGLLAVSDDKKLLTLMLCMALDILFTGCLRRPNIFLLSLGLGVLSKGDFGCAGRFWQSWCMPARGSALMYLSQDHCATYIATVYFCGSFEGI